MALVNKIYAFNLYNYYLSNYYYFYYSVQKLHKYIYKGFNNRAIINN